MTPRGCPSHAARCVIFSFGVLAAVFGPVDCATAQPALEIHIEAARSSLLLGEPLILLISVRAQAVLDLEADLTFPAAPLKVLIDRGQGLVPYVERAWVSADRDRTKRALPPEGERLEYVLSFDDQLGDWVFPAPGSYPVVAEYQDDALGPIRSNSITIGVAAPSGEEREVHDAVRSLGPELLGFHDAEGLGPLSALAATHPASVYLQEPRLVDLRCRVRDILSGYEPRCEELPVQDPPAQPTFRPDVLRGWYQNLLTVASALVPTAGQFEPDVLLELAGIHEGLGEKDVATQIYRDITDRFPDRKAAKRAREALGDTMPPTLQVSASPPALWPPNHKLVPITITASVSDDTDPTPSVKLVSVTCNDACDPAQDIAGAALNTGDRDFQLRAERTGGGAGRTYTMTYSATDASGNTATAQATVIVPHDQR